MAQFQQIVLDYLEHYKPTEYQRLVEQRELREAMDRLVERLYGEAERVMAHLREAHPGASEEERRIEAERVAIATILPFPTEDENNI